MHQILRPLAVIGLVLAVGGCHEPLKNEIDVKALVAEADGAAFVSGRSLGLGEPEVLNDKDFVYAVAFDGSSREVSFVHHVTVDMELSVSGVDPAAPRFQRPVNHHQYDIEDVAFVEPPGGSRYILTPSRQGIARRFSAADGAPAGELIYGAPLLRVAVNPSQTLLALGAADGRVLLLDAVTLAFRGEGALHTDEVQGLVFLDDRRLLSTSFDGTLVESRVDPGAPATFAVRSMKLAGGAQAFLAHLDGVKAVSTVRDLRQPSHAITSAAVARLGLSPALDEAPLPVVTPLGTEPRPVVELGELQLRYLSFGAQRAAVCDECVPEGAELVLGRPALERATLGDDFAKSETLVKAGRTKGLEPESGEEAGGPEPAAPIGGALLLVKTRHLSLPGPGTDVDVDRRRKRAVVAYSHARAQRDPDLYEAEKRGVYPPPSPASAAVMVDLERFELGRRLVGHTGFTVTAAISPDGKTVATGGWDKRLIVYDIDSGQKVTERELAWLLRRVRFSPDGRLLAAAAWTPTNPIGEGKSEPSLLVYPVVFDDPTAAGEDKTLSRAE